MSNARSNTISILISLILLVASAGTPAYAVIYGSDDRQDVYELAAAGRQEIVDLAIQSTAVLMSASDIDASDPNDVILNGPALGDYLNLCDDERFFDQLTAGFCSGTLIDDDLFLTAGHCIESESECAEARFVFHYALIDPVAYGPITVDDIYQCESIIVRESTWQADYAIIQLDRPVGMGLSSAPIVRGGLFEYGPAGDQVFTLGHPYGIPLKFADNAEVKETHADTFTANLDHFGGNSGSSVFNSEQEVVGILVRGETDYVYDNAEECYRSNYCSDESGCDLPSGAGFETVIRTNLFAQWLPARCGDGLCDPGEDEIVCPDDCPQDSDYDLVEDAIDNCPWLPNNLQDNLDGDPFGDACDCDWINGDVWSIPGEVLNLTILHDQAIGWTTLTWDPPLEAGAVSIMYDTLRSELPMDFLGPVFCVESDDGLDTCAEDPDFLSSGMAYYYLVRAQNMCPAGEGPLGSDGSGKPREGRACP